MVGVAYLIRRCVSKLVDMGSSITSMAILTRPLILWCSNRNSIARHLPVLAYPFGKGMQTLPSAPFALIVATVLLSISQRLIRHVLCVSSGLRSRNTSNIRRKAVIPGKLSGSSMMFCA
jgi:hypothetical protein